MTPDDDPFFTAGKYRALAAAIEALVVSAKDRERALTSALNAIEAEIARELYMPGRSQGWIDGLQAAKDEVEAVLRQAIER